MNIETRTPRLVREGSYVAEVEITLIDTDHEWAPYVSAADVRKLDEARRALRDGDLQAAARLGRIFELKPVAAE